MDYKNAYLRTVFPEDDSNSEHESWVKVIAFFFTFEVFVVTSL